MAVEQNTSTHRECANCGTPFQHDPGLGNRRRYCGIKCKRASRYRGLSEEQRARRREYQRNRPRVRAPEVYGKWLEQIREWQARNPDRIAAHKSRIAAAYSAHCRRGYRLRPCEICGRLSPNEACRSCSYGRLLIRAWERNSKGKVMTCSVCGSQWCNLHGRSSTAICSDACGREARKAVAQTRRVRQRAGRVERVIRSRVFNRDGWRCQACGCHTPPELRGTYERCAPELDHRVPLAKGGEHTYANTHLLCRACNLSKGQKDWESFKQKQSVASSI